MTPEEHFFKVNHSFTIAFTRCYNIAEMFSTEHSGITFFLMQSLRRIIKMIPVLNLKISSREIMTPNQF